MSSADWRPPDSDLLTASLKAIPQKHSDSRLLAAVGHSALQAEDQRPHPECCRLLALGASIEPCINRAASARLCCSKANAHAADGRHGADAGTGSQGRTAFLPPGSAKGTAAEGRRRRRRCISNARAAHAAARTVATSTRTATTAMLISAGCGNPAAQQSFCLKYEEYCGMDNGVSEESEQGRLRRWRRRQLRGRRITGPYRHTK